MPNPVDYERGFSLPEVEEPAFELTVDQCLEHLRSFYSGNRPQGAVARIAFQLGFEVERLRAEITAFEWQTKELENLKK